MPSAKATTTKDIIRATATLSATTTTVVPWCTDSAAVRVPGGCHQSQYTIYCNTAISPLEDNNVVFQAHQLSINDCMGLCDSNGWCSSGMFNGETGICTLLLYAGSGSVQLIPTVGAVQSFEFIYNTLLYRDCPAYECPDSSAAQCCGGMGCADVTAPYGA